MSIVVTGATGQLGGLVVEELLARGVPAAEIVATGRSAEKLAGLARREVRTARLDYGDPATAESVLSAGDTLLLVSGTDLAVRAGQHRAVIDAAKRAGVARLVYTSILAADGSGLFVAPSHRETERDVRESGIPFTLLRNGWYSENYAQALAQARDTGVVLSSAGDGRVASATRRDYAAGAAAVLATDGHDGAVHEFSGDTAWTFDDLAATFTELLGRPVTCRHVDPDEHRAILQEAGLDEGTAGFVVALDGCIRDGALGLTTGDLSRLSGRPTTPLAEALRPFA